MLIKLISISRPLIPGQCSLPGIYQNSRLRFFASLGVCLFWAAGVCQAQGQDLIQVVQNLTLEKDSLRRVLKQEEQNHLFLEKKLKDSLSTIQSVQKNALAQRETRNRQLEKELADCNRKLGKSGIEEVNFLEKAISLKDDSIKYLKGLVDAVSQSNTTLNESYAAKERDNVERGRSAILDRILQDYRKDSFDELVGKINLFVLNRDLEMIGRGVDPPKVMKDLKIYFVALALLSDRYSEAKAVMAISQLESTGNKSKVVLDLIQRLKIYKLCSDALKATIKEIMQFDEKISANNEKVAELKLKDIMTRVSSYVFNYRFEVKKFPYLSGILFEMLDIKYQDSNASLAALYSKL